MIYSPKRSPDYQFQKQSYTGLLIFCRTENKELSSQTIVFRNGGDVPAGVPQDTKLGPWLFLLMIKDTTVSEVVKKGDTSKAQDAVSTVENWSSSNGLHLNADKCKELQIDFKTTKQSFDPLTVNGKKLPVVKNAKILGLTISSNLKWTDHINEVIKNGNKRLYFIILLKRAKISPKDIANFYCTVIRPILEYCAPVFHY